MIITILCVFLFCFLLERAAPGWQLPKVRTWPVRVLLINGIQVAVLLLAGVMGARWPAPWAVFRLSTHLSPLAGGAIAYFIATFVFYWWHRLRHEHDFLWLAFHQIHHSPRRLEVITSFYKHPVEMIVNFIIGSVLAYPILGLSLEGAAIYTCFTAIGEFFYHTNVRTPRWIGYVFQRPEMHRIHHQHGRHKNNYGDITWWDMLFGTYENPKEWVHTCGYEAEKEERLGDMLAFRDVHKASEP
jgi:sterol desaturase/sphingolipid hydroxylase (fatty acid hydroxylase superfamily)